MNTPEQDPNNLDPNNLPTVRAYEVAPVPASVPGEGIAERFVDKELVDARRSLRNTQIGATVLTLFIMAYTGYIASHLNHTLEPKVAAQVATGLIMDQVDNQGPQITAAIKERVPKLIEQAPDYAIKQMPGYRSALENKIESDMRQHFTSSSAELGKSFDELLDANKDNISLMLKNGQDPQAMRAVGNAVQQEMMDYMKTTSVNGESLSAKLDETFDSLDRVDKRMTKLAQNTNLRPQEQKARRAIGILAQSIDTAHAQHAGMSAKTI